MTDRRIQGVEETWLGLRTLLAEVTDEQWSRPTPCTDWSVHDLAAHLGAIESQMQGLPQPETPVPDPTSGLDGWTAAGVQARRHWTAAKVLEEIAAASSAQIEHLRGLDADEWDSERFGPLGQMTEESLAAIRTFDLYTHLLDLRTALDRPLGVDVEDPLEPTASAICSEWAFEVTPWAAAKVAKLDDGVRIRIDTTGPGGRTVDLVMTEGRARLEPPVGDVADVVTGRAIAYTMLAAGREGVAERAGGVRASGPHAETFVARFRMFG